MFILFKCGSAYRNNNLLQIHLPNGKPSHRFPQIKKFKRFENGFEKKFPDLKNCPLILTDPPPPFSLTGKSSKFSLIGGNPASSTFFTDINTRSG